MVRASGEAEEAVAMGELMMAEEMAAGPGLGEDMAEVQEVMMEEGVMAAEVTKDGSM